MWKEDKEGEEAQGRPRSSVPSICRHSPRSFGPHTAMMARLPVWSFPLATMKLGMEQACNTTNGRQSQQVGKERLGLVPPLLKDLMNEFRQSFCPKILSKNTGVGAGQAQDFPVLVWNLSLSLKLGSLKWSIVAWVSKVLINSLHKYFF